MSLLNKWKSPKHNGSMKRRHYSSEMASFLSYSVESLQMSIYCSWILAETSNCRREQRLRRFCQTGLLFAIRNSWLHLSGSWAILSYVVIWSTTVQCCTPVTSRITVAIFFYLSFEWATVVSCIKTFFFLQFYMIWRTGKDLNITL